MRIFNREFSFVRVGLPVIAIIGILVSAWFVATGLPDRGPAEPQKQPPQASGALADSPRVAGVGLVEPSSETIDIGAALSGLVTDLRVSPGDLVEKGQALFVVDQRAARSRLKEARAAMGEARAAIREAQSARATAAQQLALYKSIEDPAAVSKSEVIRAEGEAKAAASRLALARARLGAAQAAGQSASTELGRLIVRAPIAGEILAVNIHPGEYVSTMGGNSQPFIRMGQTHPLHVRIDVDENEAARIIDGSDAVISARGNARRQIKAHYVRTEPLVVPKRSLTNSAAERVDVRVFQLIYRLPDSARENFQVGQQVDAFIPAHGAKK